MNIGILIIVAIAFLIVGFLVGNLFPVLSGFLNAEADEEAEKEEASGRVIEEHDSGLPEREPPEPDLPEQNLPEPVPPVAVQTSEPITTPVPEWIPQRTTSLQAPASPPQAEQPQPQPESAPDEVPTPQPLPVMDAPETTVEQTDAVVSETPLEEQIELPEKAPRQRPTFGLVDVMHIWRDEKTKELVVEFEERVVRPTAKITNEEHGELAKLLIDLNDWVGLETQMEAMERYRKERKKGLAPGSIRDYSKKKATDEEGEAVPIKPRVGIMEMFVRAIQTDVNAPLPEGLVSIVEQINYVLQEKLEGTPFAQRGIELQELPGQGMLFVVGLEKYHEIGEIPDEEIQTIIRSAVAEWEQRVAEQDED